MWQATFFPQKAFTLNMQKGLGKFQYFTNLDFPETVGFHFPFSTLPQMGANRACDVSMIWPDGYKWEAYTPSSKGIVLYLEIHGDPPFVSRKTQ